MERKQGVTNLERMCEEIEEEERIKEQRKELKRQKKKRKKALAKSERENLAHQTEQEASHCEVSHGVQGGLRRGGGVCMGITGGCNINRQLWLHHHQ